MPTILYELRAEMEDGTTYDVVADQRDLAKWEVQDFGCPFTEMENRAMLASRWLAWSALSRRGLIDLKWPDFDAQCVEVGSIPEPNEADPGQPAQSEER